MPNSGERQVDFSQEFRRNLRRLARKYRRIKSDVQPLINALEQGETPGDRVQQVGYVVYKVRVRNTNVTRGKSGGYRVVYYLQTPERVILITIYSKTEQGDVASSRVREIIEQLD